MKKYLRYSLFLFYLMMPFLLQRTGGIESSFTSLYILAPLGILYWTASRAMSTAAVILTVVQVSYFYSLHGPLPSFSYSPTDPFYPQVLLVTTLVGVMTLLIGWMFSKSLDRANEELAESRKLRSIGTMANGLAHEVNNPLAILSMRTSVALKLLDEHQTDSEEFNSHIQGMTRAAKRITDLMQKLSLITTMERSRPKERCDLKKILESILSKQKMTITAQNLYVEGYPDLLERCFRELLSNAEYASGAGTESPWIHIRLRQKGNFAVLTITNSGKGIPPDVQSRIFDPFFTTRSVGEGTGLGLSICQAIVEMHGGTIRYNSKSINPQFLIQIPIG